ncbi:Uma2 family endonuclease [Sandaracinobacteroides saxicola]|uniref:Uma2 family endonuclease n=1 Tax=Sandaracinobacteroides saxicola TaxID=2759707 RepID=A0A7G5IGK2_9SPHN|nr:Uma2 family endonuclease [Sandaracinobacteroides saxicola]QMW22494.1 Uma2 family endonuclease [Sandaracinobacteroides saxicola]
MNAPFAPPATHQRLPLTVDDLRLLHDHGAFNGIENRVELIGGDILLMNSMRMPHAHAVGELGFRLRLAIETFDRSLRMLAGVTLAFPPHDAPEPDLVLTCAAIRRDYLPGAEALLVVEVADSSADFDRNGKAVLYATHGVPEYWVIDLAAGAFLQHADPSDGRFARVEQQPLAGEARAWTLPDLAISLDGLAA